MKETVRIKPDKNWLEARKRLLKEVKLEVARRLGEEPEDVRAYRNRLERELRTAWAISNKSELLSHIESADVVYGGDFHASGQAQRTHLRILRSLPGDRRTILALECFPYTAQKWLDRFCAGEIELEDLRLRSNWDKAWGFPWEHYRPLLELARQRGFSVLALNDSPRSKSHGKLEHREELAAERIRHAYQRSPGALIYVVFGDLHLAKGHLPKRVRTGLKTPKRLRDVVIHLNSEKIYFQLAERGLELSVEVVKFVKSSASNKASSKHSASMTQRFCILSSPPWVQWQSYLLFMDRFLDDSVILGGVDESGRQDLTDQVARFVRLITVEFGLKLRLDQLAVYSSEDNEVWARLERGAKASDREVVRAWLAMGRSFYVPSSGAAYLASATVNHASSLAGEYIHAVMSGRGRMLWRMPSDLEALIWTEAVAYFVSKLVNHQRRAPTVSDLRMQVAMSSSGDLGREAMRLALDRRLSEILLVRQGRKRPPQVRPRRKASYFEAARILGSMLGERLYAAYRSRKLKKSEIAQWMKHDVTRSGFLSVYEGILRRLGEVAGDDGFSKSRRERL